MFSTCHPPNHVLELKLFNLCIIMEKHINITNMNDNSFKTSIQRDADRSLRDKTE